MSLINCSYLSVCKCPRAAAILKTAMSKRLHTTTAPNGTGRPVQGHLGPVGVNLNPASNLNNGSSNNRAFSRAGDS
jgi:hypothetical protein